MFQKRSLLVMAIAVLGVMICREAFARQIVVRIKSAYRVEQGLAPWDFCGGRLPGYGVDACGFREVRYGPGHAGGAFLTILRILSLAASLFVTDYGAHISLVHTWSLA